MNNEMMVDGLRVLTAWLYDEKEKESLDDCKQYLATHEAQARSFAFAMATVVDVIRQFREGK